MELRLCKFFIFSLSAKRLPLRVRNFHCELLSLTFSFTTQGAYVMYDESHQHDKKANHKQISISSLHSDSKHMLDWWAAKKKLVIFLWVVFGESGFLKTCGNSRGRFSLSFSPHSTILLLLFISDKRVSCCLYILPVLRRLFVWRRARFCGSLMVLLLHRAVGNMVNASDMSVCEEAAFFARFNCFWH